MTASPHNYTSLFIELYYSLSKDININFSKSSTM